MSGIKWKRHRKIATRTMSLKSIRNYVEVFDKRGKRMADKLKMLCDKGAFDIMEIIEGCTIDIVCG